MTKTTNYTCDQTTNYTGVNAFLQPKPLITLFPFNSTVFNWHLRLDQILPSIRNIWLYASCALADD